MKLETQDQRDHYCATVQARPLPLEATVKRYTEPRTEPQNHYLFGVCYPVISEAMGFTVADLHEWVCGAFFGWEDHKVPKNPNNPHGIESRPFRTTTRDEHGSRDVIDPETFGKLLERVVFPTAARIDVVIPEPYKP